MDRSPGPVRNLGNGRTIRRTRRPLVYGKKRGKSKPCHRQTIQHVETPSTSNSEPFSNSGFTYHNTNNNPINAFLDAIDPAVLEQSSMTLATSTGASFDRHEQQPTPLPNGPLSTSNMYNTHCEKSNEFAAQFGHHILSPSNTGLSSTNGVPTSQGPVVYIRNASKEFEAVNTGHNLSYQHSVIHPVALRRLGLEPMGFPEGPGMINQSFGYGFERFNRFVKVTVKVEGGPEARIVNLLVYNDSVCYTGIDLVLGRRFPGSIGNIYQPPYGVSELGGMFDLQPQIALSLNTTEGIPTSLPGWPQNEAPAYAGDFAGLSPVHTPIDMFSPGLLSNDTAGMTHTDLDDDWLSFAGAQDIEGPSASKPQGPVVFGGHYAPPSHQLMAYPSGVAGSTDGMQAMPALGSIPEMEDPMSYTLHGGLYDMSYDDLGFDFH